MMKTKKIRSFLQKNWFVILILVFGVFFRCYQFGSIPAPAGQDEISASYEGFALLTQGTDRWGNPFPAYFLSWGSGQNVLQSYLSIPFISVLGLNIISTRLVSLLFNILTLPLFYFLLKKYSQPKEQSKNIAIFGLTVLVFSPWHIMMGRWALESNLLPFFILLGIYALYESMHTRSRMVIMLSLVPFALAIYSYATSFFVIPIFLAIFILKERKNNPLKKYGWSYLIFLIMIFPFLLFLIKNYLVKDNLPFENSLPFSIPLLISSRLEEIQDGSFSQTLISNLSLCWHNFYDGLNTNMVKGPLSYISPVPFGMIGWLLIIINTYKVKLKTHKDDLLLIFACCSLLIFLVPLNMNRANILYLPMIGLFASAFVNLCSKFSRKIYYLAIGLVILLGIIFSVQYFTYYNNVSASDFNIGFDNALRETEDIAYKENINNIYITTNISLNYIYFLYTKQFFPQTWLENSDIGGVTVFRTDNYYFMPEPINNLKKSYIFLEKDMSEISEYCNDPLILKEFDLWIIGKCRF